eukprot:4777560-Prymnesium_polylepis.1
MAVVHEQQVPRRLFFGHRPHERCWIVTAHDGQLEVKVYYWLIRKHERQQDLCDVRTPRHVILKEGRDNLRPSRRVVQPWTIDESEPARCWKLVVHRWVHSHALCVEHGGRDNEIAHGASILHGRPVRRC